MKNFQTDLRYLRKGNIIIDYYFDI